MKVSLPSPSNAVEACVASATSRIAPLWPLHRFVAVNPFHGLMHLPFAEACALLRRNGGAAPLLAADEYLALYEQGRITDHDLAAVAPQGTDPAALHEALSKWRSAPPAPAFPLSVFADRDEGRAHWAPFIIDEIGKTCATVFDENQAAWTSPFRAQSLFAAWRSAAAADLNPEVFGLRRFRRTVAALPESAMHTIAHAVEQLRAPEESLTDFFHAMLLSVGGWAAFLTHRVHEAALQGQSCALPRELLAIRLAYEVALLNSGRVSVDAVETWRGALADLAAPVDDPRWIWQHAYERRHHHELAETLLNAPLTTVPERPVAQAVFCIDVRSETLRRHLEQDHPGLETIGFAGFFGFATQHASPSREETTVHGPVLIPANLTTCEPLQPETAERRLTTRAVQATQAGAASAFSMVEIVGLAAAPALAAAAIPPRPRPRCSAPAPLFDDSPAGLESLARLAAGAIRGLSLSRGFARVVLLCGHGSTTANNPHASSLQCGACGGHAGDLNARAAAAIFNHPGIRARLPAHGVHVPADTWFIAGLHDTVTDEVQLFDPHLTPTDHRREVGVLQEALESASRGARAEREQRMAPALPEGRTTDPVLRSVDPSEVRPEWGLAGNAAIIIAPRARTRSLALGNAAFLHEYDPVLDVDGAVLRQILSAPVIVATWINLQYYACRTQPGAYGAGSKVLHNVVGGFGVFEGNGGDLKPGLPLQSLHDGATFVHDPLRLTVVIEAPRHRISSALSAVPAVQAWLDHGWIHLLAVEPDAVHVHVAREGWRPLATANGQPSPRRATANVFVRR